MTRVEKPSAEKFAHHTDLLNQMAQTVGVDLPAAEENGELPHFPVRDMVFRCSNCADVGSCEKWLAQVDPANKKVPSYCRNKVILDGLRGTTAAE